MIARLLAISASPLLIAAALFASPLLAQEETAKGPPNVVMILSDDQAWTDYGFMGHEAIRTPNIDKLARRSLTYTRGYVPDSLCRPSLASIITGLYPHQHGIAGNDPPYPPSTSASASDRYLHEDYLPVREEFLRLHIDRAQTLPDLLKAKGYVSFQSGKWWEGNHSRGGFDEGMTHGDPLKGGRHGDEGLKIGRETMEPVFDFVDRAVADEKPFFLWYAPMLPHTPHNPPRRLLKRYQDVAPTPSIAKYWAMCEWFDETVGQLLDGLDERGLTENTLVVYVCDNGWINEPDSSRYAAKSKRSQYDGGLRTPIMVSLPGTIAPRMDESSLASSIDLAPTILRTVGLEPTSDMQGLDLRDGAAVEARNQVFGAIYDHDIVAMEDPAASLQWRWTVKGNWKLIVPYESRLPDAPVELYDLSADPSEEKDLAAEHPGRVADLRKDLDAWWTP